MYFHPPQIYEEALRKLTRNRSDRSFLGFSAFMMGKFDWRVSSLLDRTRVV